MPLGGNVRQDEGYEDDDSERQSFDRPPQPYHQTNDQLRRCDKASRGTSADGQPSNSQAKQNQRTITPAFRGLDTRSVTPSDTEADDDAPSYLKALPAPTLRPRKGLRSLRNEAWTQDSTPFLTPSQLINESLRADDGYFEKSREEPTPKADQDEARKARKKFTRRRRAELGRRCSELVSLIFLCIVVLCNDRSWIYAKLCWKGTFAIF